MKYVTYLRVSTKKQGESKLGLEAQEAAVKRYAEYNGGEIIESFTEVETGTSKKKRTKIYEAIDYCKQHDAVLLIAKLDRLSRDEFFTYTLLNSIEKNELKQFICCDNPHVNRMTIKLLSVIASEESKTIRERLKAAFAAKRLRGEAMGRPHNFTEEERNRGKETLKTQKLENFNIKRALNYAKMLRKEGLSLRAIAKRLNDDEHKTSTGKQYNQTQVSRLINL